MSRLGTITMTCRAPLPDARSDHRHRGQPRGRLASYSNYGAVTIMAPWRGGGSTRKGKLPRGVWSVVRVNARIEGVERCPARRWHRTSVLSLALARPDWRGKPDLIERKLRESASPVMAGACPNPAALGSSMLPSSLTPVEQRGLPMQPSLTPVIERGVANSEL